MKKESMDIKALTAELKGRQKANKKLSEVDQHPGEKEKLYTYRSIKSSTSKSSEHESPENSDTTHELIEIIRSVNAKDHYKVDRFFYVDQEIHELFIQLKAQTRLKISHLVSSLLEEFILKHQAAIREVISRKPNKFLK